MNCAGFFVAGLITLLVAASADGVSTLELAHVCVGDCDSDGAVHINELIVGVNIALGVTSVSACPAFECPQYVSGVFINCAVQAVDNALLGCRPATIIPSATATPMCPLPAQPPFRDDFVREVEALMKPGTSTLFVLDDEGDMILHGIRGLGGTVVKTNVDLERSKLIQSTLAAASAATMKSAKQ